MTKTQRYVSGFGYADFFDTRRKGILVRIAEITPSDVFYDLGCGDASLLIYVVTRCKLKKAVGFEVSPGRVRKARLRIKQAGLEKHIFIKPNDFYEEDLSEADVIFHMLPESSYDLRYFQSKRANIRNGSKLIKHDLPLVGYLPDKIDLPFYLMKFPLRKARSINHWVSVTLGEPNSTPAKLWDELYYYKYEKGYYKADVEQLRSLLYSRFRNHD